MPIRPENSACGQFKRDLGRVCGAPAAGFYIQGWRCSSHTPSALAGLPEPPGGACAPERCYCRACPSWKPDTTYDLAPTVVDDRAVASGKRRAPLGEYRRAQKAVNRG